MNHEPPDVQAGFRKGRETRDQIANICWIIEKARAFQKNIYFCFIDYAKDFDCVDQNKLWEILRDGNTRPSDLPPEKSVWRLRSNMLELDIEQQTGSKSGKEYIKAVYCHPAYLTSMKSTSWDAGLEEAQAGIKIARRNINNLRYADDKIGRAHVELQSP